MFTIEELNIIYQSLLTRKNRDEHMISKAISSNADDIYMTFNEDLIKTRKIADKVLDKIIYKKQSE